MGCRRRHPLRAGTHPAYQRAVPHLRPWCGHRALRRADALAHQVAVHVPGGHAPLTFTVGGVRFGFALGMETHYPELFAAHELDDVDCVLVSTAGSPEHPDVVAVEAPDTPRHSLWVSLAGPVGPHEPPAGLANPHGAWVARCPAADHDAIVAAQIDTTTGRRSRTWRRHARESTARTDERNRPANTKRSARQPRPHAGGPTGPDRLRASRRGVPSAPGRSIRPGDEPPYLDGSTRVCAVTSVETGARLRCSSASRAGPRQSRNSRGIRGTITGVG